MFKRDWTMYSNVISTSIRLGGPMYLVKKSNKHALPIMATKLSLKHHCTFANATKVLLRKSNP